MYAESYFYLSRQIAKCMMRFNSHVGPVRTQITSTQNIPNDDISMLNIPKSVLCTRDNQKESTQTRSYRMSLPQTRANQKELSKMHFLWTRLNQKGFT